MIRAAQAGKHVLCEKPCAVNADDLAEMIGACKTNNVQFMDGVMFMHSQRLQKVKEALDGIGELRRITTHFSFCGDDEFDKSNIRTSSELEPLGCLGDLGWYSVRFALWLMNFQIPDRVEGRFLKQLQREDCNDSVPIEFAGELHFGGGVTSSFYSSFETGYEQWAQISGTKGNISIHDFVNPFAGPSIKFQIRQPGKSVDTGDFGVNENDHTIVVDEPGSSGPLSQETNLFRKFGSLVLSGQVDDHWPNIALQTQQVVNACFAWARQETID